jgi:cold shock CspA family protein
MSTETPATPISSERLIGRVKWFNNKAGYGFVTVCDGEYANKDIFSHYSAIRNEDKQYCFLTQGEYVEFLLTKSNSDKYEYLAVDISGIKGGPILCETRRLAAASFKPVGNRPPSPSEEPPADFTPVKPKSRPRKPAAKPLRG